VGYHVAVIRALVVLAILIAGLLTFVTSGAQAAGSAQTLGIVLHRNMAATERLPHYRTAAPIAVNVGGDAARLPSLTVTAHGPNGAAVIAPLARTGNTFSGNLQLLAPGAWTVALSTKLGSVSAALASVPLDVVSEDGADLAARFTFALSALLLVAGFALILRVNGRPLALAYVRKRN
jgi:hypothetical protein